MRDRDLCSRREADTLLAAGRVLVEGVPAALGQLVDPSARLQILGAEQPEVRRTFALYKPPGVISQARQPRPGQRYAWHLLEAAHQAPGCSYSGPDPRRLPKLGCCGRLDVPSTGLLIFSEDGRTARRLVDRMGVWKHYEVQVSAEPRLARWGQARAWREGGDWDTTIATLRHGIVLDGKPLLPARVSLVPHAPLDRGRGRGQHRGGASEPSKGLDDGFLERRHAMGEDTNSQGTTTKLRISIQEGRFHQIRRMCSVVGLHVTALHRSGIGSLALHGLGLAQGQWCALSPDQVAKLVEVEGEEETIPPALRHM